MKRRVMIPPIVYGTGNTQKGRGNQMKNSFFKEIGELLDIVIDNGPEFPVIHTEKGG